MIDASTEIKGYTRPLLLLQLRPLNQIWFLLQKLKDGGTQEALPAPKTVFHKPMDDVMESCYLDVTHIGGQNVCVCVFLAVMQD